MNQYQLVPYTYTIHVSGDPSELRDLSDIDASGLSALEFIAQAARAHMGAPRLQNTTDTTSMQVQQVSMSAGAVAITAASGLRGVRADISGKRGGKPTSFAVTESDWTHTPVRNVFVAPAGKVGMALVERVGTTGVVTKLEDLLRKTLKATHSDLIFTMKPAMSPEAIEAWAKDARVKAIVLRQTNTKSGQQGLLSGLPFGQVIEFRANRKQSWSSKLFGGKLSANTQKELLTEVIPQLPGLGPSDAEERALSMLEEGWTVAVAMRNQGRQRLVELSTKASITMTFPASASGIVGARPDHADFQQACQNALQELGDDNMHVGQPADCAWTDEQWDTKKPVWKAVWGAPE